MCTIEVKMDDAVMNRIKPHFAADRDMMSWMENVLKKAMIEYAEEVESKEMKKQETRKLIERLEALKNDPDGFFKMGGILGKPKEPFSWDEIREKALFEKYGI